MPGTKKHGLVQKWLIYPLVISYIAMENGPFIDGLPGFTYYKW
jgi:hypothetical protein